MPTHATLRAAVLAGCLLAGSLLVAAGCDGTDSRVADGGAVLAEFERNTVHVAVAATPTSAGANPTEVVLTTTFTPLSDDLHLFDQAMPADGIDGIGRPTRATVVAGGRAVGKPAVDVEVIELREPQLDLVVPVYPDGPVTLTQRVQVDPGASTLSIEFTYMACYTSGGCTIPVVGHQVDVAIPGDR